MKDDSARVQIDVHRSASLRRGTTTAVLTASAALMLAMASAVPGWCAESGRPPNIVILFADDLGWGDLACYGHPTIRTPNLDRMAAEGMRFTEFYSAAEVCTPSRTALLTGRYPIRSGMCHDQFRVLRSNAAGGLPPGEVTLAEALKPRGYATACVGKWHLGHLPQHLPPRHGFDEYFGMPFSNDMMPAPGAPKGREKFFAETNEFWQTPLIRGDAVVDPRPDQRRLTGLYTAEAVKYIREHKGGPFFLYLAHTFPHVPLFASEGFRGKSPAGIYGDVVEELDWSVGQVLDALRTEGLAENTFVFFTSDNGPWLIFDQHGGSAGPLRDGKGSTWEGGMREPGIAWWPGRVPAGVVEREMATTMDLFTTCVKLAGAELPGDRAIDGLDISPLLFGTGTVERGVYCYYRGERLFAARLGPWKAHFLTQSSYGQDKPQAHDPPLLFHLGVDPGERFNVAAKHPDVLAQIAEAVGRHRATVEPVPSQLVEVVARHKTDWMHQARWGVMTHYLGAPPGTAGGAELTSEAWNARVDAFDVPGLADQLSSAGVKYLLFTLGQNSGHYCSPNATYDKIVGIAPSKCSRRDLVADLAAELKKRGIRLMVYLPNGAPAADHVARQRLGWRWGSPGGWQLPGEPVGGRLVEFQRHWEAIIREWSLRWGTSVSGWWIDGCYFADDMYRFPDEPNFASFAAALRAGNPEALVAFNPGVRIPVAAHTKFEDYAAGEVNIEQLPQAVEMCQGRWLDAEGTKVQFQILTFLGETWCGGDRPHWPDEKIIGLTRQAADKGGAITYDVPIQTGGRIPEPFVEQLRALGRAMR